MVRPDRSWIWSMRVGLMRRPPLANIEYAAVMRITVVSPAPSDMDRSGSMSS
jgi:hypothetical protein